MIDNKNKQNKNSLSIIDESNDKNQNFLQSQEINKKNMMEKEKNNFQEYEDSLDQFRPFSAMVTDNFDFSIKENTMDLRRNNTRKNTTKKNEVSYNEGANVYNPINDLNNNDDSFIVNRNNNKIHLNNTPE